MADGQPQVEALASHLDYGPTPLCFWQLSWLMPGTFGAQAGQQTHLQAAACQAAQR